MNLNETIDLLKEMVNNYSELEGDDFLIAPSKVRESSVEGYEIHMTGKFSETVRKYVNDLALRIGLAITQHPGSIMMYRAKAKPNAK